MPIRPRAHARRVAAALLLAVALSGCGLLGIRQQVDEAQARELLDTAVTMTRTGDLGDLCRLSPSEASTCAATLETARAVAPSTAPRVDCVVAAPDHGPLRGGRVLVLSGTDSNGDPFTTEFVVFDDGTAVGVLDAVWWSGLSIKSYDEDTVTWRFDSGSVSCERGGLPLEIGAGPTPVEPPTGTVEPPTVGPVEPSPATPVEPPGSPGAAPSATATGSPAS